MSDENAAAPAASSLRQVVGAMVFGADRGAALEEIRRCLQTVAGQGGPEARLFAQASTADIRDALTDVRKDLERLGLGVEIAEVAGTFRFRSQAACGPWLRVLLKQERPARLSRPALETLAIVAYRQPIAKAEIEGIRGVAVDHILRALMELHLVRIVGRSELPGRPFLYGTTPRFLEHFGLRNLDELNDLDPTLRRAAPRARAALYRRAPAAGGVASAGAAGDAGAAAPPEPVFAPPPSPPPAAPDAVPAPATVSGSDASPQA
jgi:segregation and condensation protein B